MVKSNTNITQQQTAGYLTLVAFVKYRTRSVYPTTNERREKYYDIHSDV